jgi:hypothetical protein
MLMKATTVDEANTDYWQRQMPLGFAFKSPFAMLSVTLTDCQKQRLELGVSDEDFERDKSTFNKAVGDIIAKHGYPDTNEKVDFALALAFEFVRGAMTKSDVPANYWPLVACHAALVTLRDEQQKKSFRVDAALMNLALFAQGMMNIAWKPERMRQQDNVLARLHALANQQQTTHLVLIEANAALTTFAEFGNSQREAQRKRARKPREKKITENLTLSGLIRKLAAKPENLEEPAKSIWRQLYGALDERNCAPSEDVSNCSIDKHFYTFMLDNGKQSKLTFGSFKVMLSKAQTEN